MTFILMIIGNMAFNSRKRNKIRGWEMMIKTGYAICTNCGCNKRSVKIYRCQNCNKTYCELCTDGRVTCSNSRCEAGRLKYKGYIQPFDEVEKMFLA